MRAELRALQLRAYGPDADIHDDPAAVARLQELEQALAPRPAAREVLAAEPREDRSPEDAAASRPPSTLPDARSDPSASHAPARRPRSARRRAAWMIAGAAVMVAVAAGAALTSPVAQPSGNGGTGIPRSSISDAEVAARTSAYLQYIEGRRTEVLDLPGAEAVAARMQRASFRPFGTLYGRLVGSGRTIDDRLCMIVEDRPAARVVCLSTPWAPPVTVVFPFADSAAFSRGEPSYIGYTLSADGSVVATPGIDPAEASAPAPERTATPAPGTQ